MNLKQVTAQSHIEIEFKLSLLDGTLVEQTEQGETFAFQVGDGQFLNKLDELLIDLEEGTQAKYNLMPDQAFGVSDPNNFQVMARSEFDDNIELTEGYVVGFHTPTGDEIPGTIFKVTETEVTVNFNHPLADQALVFEAKIMKIID